MRFQNFDKKKVEMQEYILMKYRNTIIDKHVKQSFI